MKKVLALKKIFTLKRVIIAFAIIAALAIIITPRYNKDYRNKAAKKLLQQISLAEIAMQPECITIYGGCPTEYTFTDGVSETTEAAIFKLTKYGFRPDPSVAFHIRPPATINGKTEQGFIAFAAHNSVGSTVYVYDNVSGGGAMEAIKNNSKYSGVTDAHSVPASFCYKYDPSNTAAPVEKTCSIPKPGYIITTTTAE